MQAHTLSEVGILGRVLLRVDFRTILPIFIEIDSIFHRQGEKDKLAQFFLRHDVRVFYKVFRNNIAFSLLLTGHISTRPRTV